MPLDKSPDAFRTISEVADDLDLPQHVLRFWETRFSQIKPLKRGGGRRYYRPDDVDLLRGLKRLLYGEGYTIKGVQRILKDRGPRHVIAIARGAPVEPEQDAPAPAPRANLGQTAFSLPQRAAADDEREAPALGQVLSTAAPYRMRSDASARLKAALFELSEARDRLLTITSPSLPSDDAA
ncbi:MAG: MerR family transcriptional regulator [Bosea sp. (in: a-proteobacteria)]